MDMDARYHPDHDQIALAAALADSLSDMLPVARLHGPPAEQPSVWDDLTQLGLFTISTPEVQGGSGLGVVEESLIVMALGRQLVAPGIIATLSAASLSDEVIMGKVAVAFKREDQWTVVDPDGADMYLLRDMVGARLVPAATLKSQPLEQDLWLSELALLHGLDGGMDATQQYSDQWSLLRLRLLDAATLAGLASRALDMAVSYAQTREQFGRAIGSFQAVKHSCADMAIASRCARDQVSFAAVALDARRSDAPLQVESALLVAMDAALANAGRNIQIHGGMGFSDEADPHLILKRARVFAAIAGGEENALDRIASLASATN